MEHANSLIYYNTVVFRLVNINFMGMREMNLELWQAEAPDRVVFKLYTVPGKLDNVLG